MPGTDLREAAKAGDAAGLEELHARRTHFTRVHVPGDCDAARKVKVAIAKDRGFVATKLCELASSKATRQIFSSLSPEPEDAGFAEVTRMRQSATTSEFARAVESSAAASGDKPAPWKRVKGVRVVYVRPSARL